MVHAPFHHPPRLRQAATLAAALLLAGGVRAADGLGSIVPGGEIAVTSDYIYRGVSQSDGHLALQADLHLATAGGTFLGAWASTRDSDLEPGAPAVLDMYLGHRFALSSTWSATLSARAHAYLGADAYEPSDDYQEISASLTYLDSWSVSITSIPNAVRWWFYTRLSRAPAWVLESSGQYLLGRELFLTGGAGYYRTQGPDSGIDRATGYAYGNAGLAWEHRQWRIEVGYFITQQAAERSYPYPIAEHRLAGTLSWRF